MSEALFGSVWPGGVALAQPKPLSELLERRVGAEQPGWLNTPAAPAVPRGTMAASQPAIEPDPAPEPEPMPDPVPPPPDPVVTQRMADAIQRLGEVHAGLASEPDLVELGLAIAQAVLRQELMIRPEVVVSAVQDALIALRGEKATRVRVHASTLAAVRSARPDLEPDGVELVADNSLGEGGCIVESAHRALDASVEERLERFRRAFAASLAASERGGEGSP